MGEMAAARIHCKSFDTGPKLLALCHEYSRALADQTHIREPSALLKVLKIQAIFLQELLFSLLLVAHAGIQLTQRIQQRREVIYLRIVLRV